LTKFLKEPGVVHVLAKSGGVRGITVLGSDVFVVRDTSTVDVYNSTSFTTRRKLSIPKSKQLGEIVSCSHNTCLYVSDIVQKIIYRYDLSKNVITKWSVSETCCGLSVTKSYNVLATLLDTKRIEEYTTDGGLIREISFDKSIQWPLHCVELSTGNFVVSQLDGRLEYRVCIVDSYCSGCIIKSYNKCLGSASNLRNRLCHIAVDIHDSVLVVDCDLSIYLSELTSVSLL